MTKMSNYDKTVIEAHHRGYRINHKGETINPKGKMISGVVNVDRRGHKAVKHNIRIDGRHAAFKKHRLLAYQKFGDVIFNEGVQVRHLNDDSLDNVWDNISIGTASDNLNDAYRNGKR